ncbi:TolC family protein [Sphingomonas sp.]|uniref:TolC family protein n=1 Tax=Sphingomonas sp. TaxID=28214 RepID=UPI002FD8F6A1
MTGFSCRLPRHAAVRLIAVLLGTALGGVAKAQDAPPYQTLLREAASAPRATILSAEIARAEGLAEQARARPNPTVSLLAENIAGGGPYSGLGGAENTVQLNQPFELGGKRSARVTAADAAVTAARARGLEGRIAFAHDLASAYAAVEVAQGRIELAEDEVEEAEADARLAGALVEAGKEASLRRLQAETALNAQRAELELAKAGQLSALARLSALVGSPQSFTGITGSVLSLVDAGPAIGPSAPAASAVYQTALAERDAAALRIRAERKRAVPDVTGSLGVRRLERDGATALVVGVALPLPIFDRNRGNIAAAEADARAATARAEAVRLESEAERRGALAQIEATALRVKAARASLATAQEAYRLARIAYEAGKAPLIELLSARHNLGAARGVVLDARAAQFTAYATLARLQGRTVTGDRIQ